MTIFRTKSITVSLALFSYVFAVALQGQDIRIDSISVSDDFAKIDWSTSPEGYAYTLQEKRGLQDHAWRDVKTRYRWPTLATKWFDPDVKRSRKHGKIFRLVADPIQAPKRGAILDVEKIRSWGIPQLRSLLQGGGYSVSDIQWSVDYYKVIYETIDPFGLPITASGGLFVPIGETGPIPIFSYQHGTEIYKPWVPSQDDPYWFPRALLFASSGYLTLMPDYLGLGESPGLHPWLHAKTEATCVIDLMRAVKTYAHEQGIELNDQVFLSGYSQGGHATMAAHREIESMHINEWTVTASAPMAGPYDMASSWRYLLTNSSYPTPEYILYVMAAWFPLYDLGDTLEELLAEPYRSSTVNLLNGLEPFHKIETAAQLPNAMAALAPEFRRGISRDMNHPFMQAASENNVFDWTPKAPMRLYHCAGDVIVQKKNAETALKAFNANGACCVEIVDPTTTRSLGHSDCFLPSLLSAKQWFDSMKQ